MSGRVARVWPGPAALAEAQVREAAASTGGVLFTGGDFTQDSFLPRLLEGVTLPGDRRLMPPLVGPLLVQNLLRGKAQGEDVFAGLASGWRLPRRLWRLLVELKAAGLSGRLPEDDASPRLAALARLLAAYERSMGELGLADQSDGLAALCDGLATGRLPPAAAGWQGICLEDVLWLRALDQRLLAALATRLPVRVNFALALERHTPAALAKLVGSTARYLERRGGANLELVWRELGEEGGPLAGLARAQLAGAPGAEDPGPILTIRRAAGRYGEVEALAGHALGLLERGAAAHEIVLAFPDLALYGQMLDDVAGRRGLPLDLTPARRLADAAPARAVLDLLALPLGGYARQDLARVLESPYLRHGLARELGQYPPPGAGRLLLNAGYIDARETPVRNTLERAASRGRDQTSLKTLGALCGRLTAWLEDGLPAGDARAFTAALGRLVERLDLPRAVLNAPAGGGVSAAPSSASVLARDLMTARALRESVDQLAEAAALAGSGPPASRGRLLALLRETWEATPAPGRRGAAGGVRVLTLEEARGLRPGHLLVGGLNQDEFPRRPPGQYLLSAEERRELGRRAGLPVWRTEEQEYGGQLLGLLCLLAGTRRDVMLTCAAADADGGARLPAFALQDLAGLAGRSDDLKVPRGGAFGELPPLDRAREPMALWGGLARGLLRPGAEPRLADLAQAALAELIGRPGGAARWRRLAALVGLEQDRLRLELVSGEQRAALSGPHGGRLARPEAMDLLGEALARPEARRLSPASLESYAQCPMVWFLGRLLGLKPESAASWALERDAEGRWVHLTLSKYFSPANFPAERGPLRLRRCLEEARQELADKGEGGHPFVWQGRMDLLLTALGEVVRREEDALTGWRVEAVELDLTPEAGLMVDVGHGPPLILGGRLDRLDLSPETVRVTDYKHTSRDAGVRGPLKRDDLARTAFQMPVYLAAARRLSGWQGPLAGRVAPTRRLDLKTPEITLAADDLLLAEDPDRRAEAARQGEANLFNAVTELWERLEGGDFAPRPDKDRCQWCRMGGVCRARLHPAAEGEGAA